MSAVLLSVVALGIAQPTSAGPAERLRDSLFKHRGGDAAGPPLARYVSDDGRGFVLDRTQAVTLLKFDDSPEVWVLAPSPAPRGDLIYKNDLGEPVLRVTRLGGFTLFSDARPSGEAVSMAGSAAPLRLLPISPQAVFDRLTQASLRSSRAARHLVVFDAEATPASSALIADAATVTSLAILRLSQQSTGRSMLARFSRVEFAEGRKASAALKAGVLRIIVAPADGLAGRPSSDRIMRAATAR